MIDQTILSELAPAGTLRAGINLGNALLVTGATSAGDPVGVAPDLANELATRLGVAVSYVTFASPGEVADAVARDAVDIATIGAEPTRAKSIEFTAAYVEIEATYLVPGGSPLTSIDDVDRDGVRIAVSGRSAYDNYLASNLAHAGLERAQGVSAAFDLFVHDNLEALAGLRPALIGQAARLPGARILDGSFTTVQQAVGVKRGKQAGAAFLRNFVEEAKASGLVAKLIERHGVVGKLSVAPPATAG